MKTAENCCSSKGESRSDGESYDLAVIGAGSAGFSAAITAAELGARVALVGYGTIGGTCVNIGCVPSKTLIRAAEAIHQANTAHRFGGIEAAAGVANWSALMTRKTELVDELRQAKYEDLLPQYEKITYLTGKAKPVDGGIAVNGAFISAKKTILATGSSPALPPIPGIEATAYLTSTSALELETLPKSMIVIGGGVIGCELGQMFSRFGVKVTLICRSRLLPAQEPEISKTLQTCLAREGINVITGASYNSIRQTDEIELSYEHEEKPHILKAARLLVTTGRKPNTAGMELQSMGIELDRRGSIRVDAQMQTTRKDVYAAGDVTGRDMFVYMAAYGAKIAAQNAVAGENRRYDARAMPEVVFTDPQVASVGLTQDAARAQGRDVKTSTLPLDALPRALAARNTDGLVKLIADASSKQLLGAHILAPEGGDTIQCAALAIRQGLRVDELGDMIFPYLTTVEALKLAAQGFDRDIARLSCCAG